MTPANERKAKERQAKRDAGLVRVEVWVKKDHAVAVRSYAERLNEGTLVYIPFHAGTFDSGTIRVFGIEQPQLDQPNP